MNNKPDPRMLIAIGSTRGLMTPIDESDIGGEYFVDIVNVSLAVPGMMQTRPGFRAIEYEEEV